MKAQCPSCRHKGVSFSSATDGRRKMTCDRCDRSWTKGKPLGMGYKHWQMADEKSKGE